MKIFDPKLTGSIEIQNTITGNVSIAGDLTVEGNLNSTFDSSTGTAISGAFTQDSSSFATRIDDLETFEANIDSTYATDAQLATAVSGLNASTSSYLQNTTDTLTGDLTVTGTITAQEFHTEFVSASIIYQSGSTQFGNSADDTHIFSGSVGINTSSPEQILHVEGGKTVLDGGVQSDILILRNDNGSFVLGNTANLGSLDLTSDSNFRIRQGSSVPLYISSSGNLGLGTTSPSNKLVIKDSGSPTLEINGQGRVNSLTLGVTANESQLFENSNNALAFGTNAIERLRIDSAGSVIHKGPTGAGTNLQESWYYGTDTNYRLDLNQIVSSGLVKHSFDTVNSGTTYSDNLVLDRGNVGIGTDSPDTLLHLESAGSTGANLILETTHPSGIPLLDLKGAASSQIRYIDETGTIQTRMDMTDGGGFSFIDAAGSGSPRMVINSSGNVGINQTSPSQLLHVGDGTDANRGIISIEGAGGQHLIFSEQSTYSSANAFALRPASGANFVIQQDGSSADALTLDTDGRLGIGIETLRGRIHQRYNITTFPNATGGDTDAWNNTNKSNILIEGSNNAMAIGIDGNFNGRTGWIQVGHDSPTYAYALGKLLLNPLGGSVGIGTTSPDATLDVTGTSTGLVSALKLANTHGSGGSQGQVGMEFSVKNSISVEARSTITSEERTADSNLTNLIFSVSDNNSGNPAEAFRLTGGGSAGDPTYLRMASGTGGIQFGGDTAAANALDDYEEGTWTPGTGEISGTPTAAYGKYTKIGNVVHAVVSITLQNVGADYSTVSLTLPFTAANTTEAGGAYITYTDATNVAFIYGRVTPNTNRVDFRTILNSTTTWNRLEYSGRDPELGAGKTITAIVNYFVS